MVPDIHCSRVCLSEQCLLMPSRLLWDAADPCEQPLEACQPCPYLLQVRSFGQQLLEAVAYLHDLDLIHTDLKPENILLVSLEHSKQAGSRQVILSVHKPAVIQPASCVLPSLVKGLQ